MKSLSSMIEQVAAMAGTSDLTQWEALFLSSIIERTRAGRGYDTTRLSPRQAEVIERLYRKHFGDAER